MFTNYILGLAKEDFKTANDNLPEGFEADVLPGAGNYKTYSTLLQRVGSPWGWDKRPKYANNNDELKARVALPTSNIHLFKVFNEVVGYALTIARPDLSKQFNKTIAEIENFGFAPVHNRKGYGAYFLKDTFNKLFQKGYDYIHLETRSTNHKKVLPFYLQNGMELIKTEENLAYDLLFNKTP